MPNEIIKKPDPAERFKAMILQATINNIKNLGRENTMKKMITVIALCLLMASAVMAQTTKLAIDQSQPKAYVPSGFWVRYNLATNKACTTKTYQIGSLGGFSFAMWDSVSGADSAAILTVKAQVAWRDTNPAFSCTGWNGDSILCTDSLTGGATAVSLVKWTRGYDFSSKVPRAPYLRYIITNIGADAAPGVEIYPLHTTSTQ